MSLPIFQQAITDSEGNALPDAEVTVRREYSGDLAELYDDKAAATLLSGSGSASADSTGVVEFFIAPGVYRIDATNGVSSRTYRYVVVHPINELVTDSTTARTLSLPDAGNYLRFTSNSAITCTVPAAADEDLPVGTQILCRQAGNGQITFTPASGVTVNDPYDGTATTPGQGSTVWLRKIAADEWDVVDNKVEQDFAGPKKYETYADAKADSTIQLGDLILVHRYATGGSPINALCDAVDPSGPDGGTADGFEYHDSDTAGLFQLKLRVPDEISVKLAGAYAGEISGGTASESAIQTVIDWVNSRGYRTNITLAGERYLVEGPIYIKTNAILRDGNILFDPSSNDVIGLNIGQLDGSELVRVGGIINIELVVDSNNTQTGLVGFNMSHGARACFIHQCRARMRTGTAVANKQHIGFSMYGDLDADVVSGGGVNGAYQNTFDTCAAYACDIGYRLDTAGLGEAGFKAQMNANFLRGCMAYACTSNILFLGEGAQGNEIECRGDTFVSSNGASTTVTCADIRGSFNNVHVTDEIGSRGDTQYTVAFNGTNPRYNVVRYSTQQIVTDDVLFNEASSARGKNVAINIERPINVNGDDVFSVHGREAISAGSTETVNEVLFDNRCVLVKAVARNIASTDNFTRLNFSKNGNNDTVQRVTWDDNDALGTFKTKNTDPSTSGNIASGFIYESGDYCRVQLQQSSGTSNTIAYSLYFKSLHRN